MEEMVEGVRRVVILILVFQVVLNLFSQSSYVKYFRLLEGIMVIALLITPLFAWLDMEAGWERHLERNWASLEQEWQCQELQMIEEQREMLMTQKTQEAGEVEHNE